MPRLVRDKLGTILDAAAAASTGTAQLVSQHRHIVLQVSAALNSSLTIKFQGSVSDESPDFSAAQSGTNHWDYIAVYDLQSPAAIIPGDTGVALDNDTVANNTRQYIVNTDLLKWFNCTVTAYTDGNVTVKILSVND